MLVSFSELQRLRQLHRKSRIVLVGGCYDLLHVGHVAYLECCRELGDLLVVSTSADDRIKERKGNSRPIISQRDRVRMLSSLTCVDYALVAPASMFAPDIPTVMVIRELQPDVFATSDVRFEDYADDLLERGTQVIFVPDMRITSTSEIIARIRTAE